MKTVTNVQVHDHDPFLSADRTRRNAATRDTDLLAMSAASKCMSLGTIWTGGAKPQLDYSTEPPRDVVLNLVTGEVVASFPVEIVGTLDPGHVWTGLADDLERAARAARAKANEIAGTVGATNLVKMGDTRPGDFGNRARRNTLAAIGAMREGAAKLWARPNGSPAPAPTRDARAPAQTGIAAINEANRRFWAARNGGPKDAA